MAAPAPDRHERPSARWTAGVLFDVLVPLAIGIAILAFLAAAFIGSSSSYPGL
jgi:hypothetical protein